MEVEIYGIAVGNSNVYMIGTIEDSSGPEDVEYSICWIDNGVNVSEIELSPDGMFPEPADIFIY